MKNTTAMLVLSGLVVAPQLAAPQQAAAEVFVKECRDQFMDPGLDALACDVRYTPSNESLAFVLGAGTPGPELDALETMLSSAECTTRLDVAKSEIEATWFSETTVTIPELPVTCNMTDASGGAITVATHAKVDCDKPADAWSCTAVIRETTGLSFMGGVLEGMVNGNDGLSGRLEKFVVDLAGRLGLDS